MAHQLGTFRRRRLGNGLVLVGVPGWLIDSRLRIYIYMISKLPGTQMTLVLVGKDLQK